MNSGTPSSDKLVPAGIAVRFCLHHTTFLSSSCRSDRSLEVSLSGSLKSNDPFGPVGGPVEQVVLQWILLPELSAVRLSRSKLPQARYSKLGHPA